MRRHTVLLIGLLLLAFAVRLAYWERSASLGSYQLSYDDDEYFKLGLLFSKGDFFRDPYPLRYTRAPGLPLAIAPILATFGPRIDLVLAFQVFISVLMAALIYTAARRAFGETAGAWALALMAISPTYASPAGSFLLTETLFSFLILLFLYCFWRWSETGLTLPRALGIGALLGFGALVRPAALYFFLPASAWFINAHRTRLRWALLRAAAAAVGMMLVVLPYTARNYMVYQRVILIDTLGGWNTWRDHRAENDDFWETLAKIPNPGDRDRYALERGLGNIIADPVYQIGVNGAANLSALSRLELDAFARGAGYLSDVMVDAPTLPLVAWNDLYYLSTVILGLGGILLTWRRAPALLLLWLGFSLAIVFFYHTQSRFRPHYSFALIIFAGAALAAGRGLWNGLTRRARVVWVGAVVLLLALGYSSLLPPLFVSEYYIARAQGRDIEALKAAVAAFPTYIKAHDALGDAYRRSGELDLALEAYDRALQINPTEMQARLGRIDIFRQRGNASKLAAEIRRAGAEAGEMDLPPALWWSFEPAPTRLVEVGSDTASFGYVLNMHAVQQDGDEQMRFTKERSFVKFPGISGWEPQVLVFYARAVPLPHQPRLPVEVHLNGRPAANLYLDEQWRDYEIPLDDGARAQDTLVVEFRSPTFRPSEVLEGSTDTRDLGFMLGYVELR